MLAVIAEEITQGDIERALSMISIEAHLKPKQYSFTPVALFCDFQWQQPWDMACEVSE
jgi:hypothetical protein